MRVNKIKGTIFAEIVLCLIAAALCAAACGEGASPHDAGPDASTDTDTDTDTGDGGSPYVCTQDEIDAQNAAIQAALAEAVPCFNGGIVPMTAAVNAYFMLDPDETSFSLCGDSTADQIAVNNYQAAAVAALEGMEFLCLGNSTIVEGAVVGNVDVLHAAIDALTDPVEPPADAGADAGPTDAPCAVEGLDDPLFVVDVAADGGVADVHPAEADTSPETAAYATCLDTALPELGLPCLAEMEICSVYE